MYDNGIETIIKHLKLKLAEEQRVAFMECSPKNKAKCIRTAKRIEYFEHELQIRKQNSHEQR